jgi:hypothetical protein
MRPSFMKLRSEDEAIAIGDNNVVVEGGSLE